MVRSKMEQENESANVCLTLRKQPFKLKLGTNLEALKLLMGHFLKLKTMFKEAYFRIVCKTWDRDLKIGLELEILTRHWLIS